MNSKRIVPRTGAADSAQLLPSDILAILGPPALVGSESEEIFYRLVSKFVVEFGPKTITEWLLVWDVVNINWEMIRYRRMKASFIRTESQTVKDRLERNNATRRIFRPTNLMAALARQADTNNPANLPASPEVSVNEAADLAGLLNIKKLTQIEALLERLEIRRERQLKELQAHLVFRGSTATATSDRFREESLVIEQ